VITFIRAVKDTHVLSFGFNRGKTMKKVLLTTTALLMTAGVASAEITLSGTAEVGMIKAGKVKATSAGSLADVANDEAIATAAAALATATAATASDVDQDGTAGNSVTDLAGDPAVVAAAQALAAAQAAKADALAGADASKDFVVYSGVDINMAASAETANGLTVSIATDIGGGSIADVADKEIDAQGETITAPTVTIATGGLTITAGNDLIDDYYDGDLSDYDLGVAGAMSGVTYGIAFNTERAASSQWTATAGMEMGAISLNINANEVDGAENQVKIIAGYAISDALSFTLTNDNKGAAKDIMTGKIAYAAGPLTASISQANDKDHASNANSGGKASMDMAIGYTLGSATVSYSTNESSAWEADVAYDLGGANAFIATDSNSTVLAGLNFTF
jgi:outer membrane protein OmpU